LTTCFANHCDWRIPNIHELQTILLVRAPCTTYPSNIDLAFGPDSDGNFWSSTDTPIAPPATATPWVWQVSFLQCQAQ
jgi:hypothetical protein